ncbi:MAG: OadG family transporter subunit [Planctomycetota bacterium]
MIHTLAQNEWSQALVLTLVGVGVVAVALLLLMLAVLGLRGLLPGDAASPMPTPPPKTAAPSEGQLIAVLAAAAATALGREPDDVRVVGCAPVDPSSASPTDRTAR